MNERIRQLAEQAGVKMNAYGRPIPASLASNFDELVELIVRECSDIAQTYMSRFSEDHELTKQIKEHFGVE